MSKMHKVTYKNTFLFLYFIMFLFITLDVAGGFPFSSLLRKVKYVYAVLAFVLYMKCLKKFEIKKISGIIVWLLFVIHTVLWGYLFVNVNVKIYISEHSEQMLWYLIILLVTSISVVKYRAFLDFIKVSYAALSVTLLWAFIRNLSDIRHPKFWIGALGLGNVGRWKATFGFLDANYCGYYCMVLIILSAFIIDDLHRNSKIILLQKNILSICIMDVIALIMLFSTGSRSNILSFLIFLWVYVYCYSEIISRRKAKIIRQIMTLVMGGVITGVLIIGRSTIIDFIWSNSNRANNISVNYEVFKQMNAWLTGMGYVENTYFSLDVFGYDTWNIDMYYQYIFFATGIIGIAIISIALLIILCNIIFTYRTNKNGILIMALYISMLFNAFWQVNICTYRFYPSLVLMTILLSYISVNEKMMRGDDYNSR